MKNAFTKNHFHQPPGLENTLPQKGRSPFFGGDNSFFTKSAIQTKPTETGDQSQQDVLIADQLVQRLSAPIADIGSFNNNSSKTSLPIQRKCAECEKEDEKVQRKSNLAVQRKENDTPPAGGTPAAEASQTASPANGPASSGYIVDDNAIPESGQMRKSAFLSRLKTEVTSTVNSAMSGAAFLTNSAAYIENMIAGQQNNSPAQIQSSINRYCPSATGAQNAETVIQQVKTKVYTEVMNMNKGGNNSGVGNLVGGVADTVGAAAGTVASGISSAASSVASGVGQIASGIGSMLFKENAGGATTTQSPQAVMQSLGKGKSMESSTRSKMETAFGESFSGVEIHTDSHAAQLSKNMNARAFTVGNHIAFSGGEYQPGTLMGDALMAHELAHTIQQSEGKTEDAQTKSSADYSALEEDADSAAVNVMSKLAGKDDSQLKNKVRRGLKPGLTISRCDKPAPTPTPTPTPTPVTGDEYDKGAGIAKSYIVPTIQTDSTAADTNTVQVSAGEQMIFRIIASDTDRKRSSPTSPWTNIPGAGPYQIDFSITGDAELDSSGSGTTSKSIPSLNTGNVFIFVKNTWNTTSAITVTATVKDNAPAVTAPDTGSVKDTDKTYTWNLVKRTNPCPTSLKRIAGPGATWTPVAGAQYTYQAMPDIPPAGRPDYQGQTILERFGTVTALGFTMSDLTDAWKTANPTQNTPDKVARFLWNAGGNSSFVFDSQDLIADGHGGFGDISPFKPTAFADADGVGYRLPQEYLCGTTVIGRANIDRRVTTANGIEVKKTGP